MSTLHEAFGITLQTLHAMARTSKAVRIGLTSKQSHGATTKQFGIKAKLSITVLKTLARHFHARAQYCVVLTNMVLYHFKCCITPVSEHTTQSHDSICQGSNTEPEMSHGVVNVSLRVKKRRSELLCPRLASRNVSNSCMFIHCKRERGSFVEERDVKKPSGLA